MALHLILRYAKLLGGFVVVWLLAWVYNNYGCQRVDGDEMAPAIEAGKLCTVNPGVRNLEDFAREDVVSFTWVQPGRKQANVAARVIALPGERVRMVRGDVYVNGEKLPSPYVTDRAKSPDDLPEIIVPRDSLFVLCDNRSRTRGLDSRAIGPIGLWAVNGKVK